MSTATASKTNSKSTEPTGAESMYAQKAASFAHETVDKLATSASSAEKALRDTAGISSEALKARGEQAKYEFVAASANTRALIAKHPLASAGIAFGAGMLIAALLRRR